jgi:hypothetical protein
MRLAQPKAAWAGAENSGAAGADRVHCVDVLESLFTRFAWWGVLCSVTGLAAQEDCRRHSVIARLLWPAPWTRRERFNGHARRAIPSSEYRVCGGVRTAS